MAAPLQRARHSLVHPEWVYRISADDLLSDLSTASVGMIVLHPPADIALFSSPDDVRTDEQCAALLPVAKQASRVLRPGGVVVAMGEPRVLTAWEHVADWVSLRLLNELTVVWDRPLVRRPHAVANLPSLSMSVRQYVKPGKEATCSPRSQRQVRSNVLVCEQVPDIHRQAAFQLPVQLFTYIISVFTESDDMVVDAMCGTGSALVAAEQLERPWLGGDTDLDMVRISRGRVELAEVEDSGEIRYWYDGELHRIEEE